jgi:hypothetical protein
MNISTFKLLKISFIVLFVQALGMTVSLGAPVEQPKKFTWKKEMSRGTLELYQIDLDDQGSGHFQYKMRSQEPIEADFKISAQTVDHLYSQFQSIDFFNPSKEFASPRKVADTGLKTLRVETPVSQREVHFNYSDDKIIWQIIDFYENLCQQERSHFELEVALKYDKLGVAKRLEDLENALKSNRLIAPERFLPILEKIYNDPTIMNLARVNARQLMTLIQKKQSK